VRWTLHPGRGIDTDSAVSAGGASAQFTFTVPRWGRRETGTVQAVLHDRWRIAEGTLSLSLPPVDCYPHPAVQRTRVVLSRLLRRQAKVLAVGACLLALGAGAAMLPATGQGAGSSLLRVLAAAAVTAAAALVLPA
jgi:hypothetical protein